MWERKPKELDLNARYKKRHLKDGLWEDAWKEKKMPIRKCFVKSTDDL